jgi:hypothetical protein
VIGVAAAAAAAASGLGPVAVVLTILAGLAALLVVLAAAVAYYRASYARATIETLRDSNAALTDRVIVLEASETRLTAENTAQKQELVNLRTYVSGTEAVHALGTKVDAYHQELTTHRRDLVDRLDVIARSLR